MASMAHALLWTGGAKWLSQLASWLSMIVVARLLTPEDFGLVGMAQIFLGLVAILSEFGLANAIVAHPDLSEEHVAQLNSVAVMVGVGALILTCMAAAPLGRFFMAPQLPPVVVATSSVFVITAFRTVPNAVLQKELRFRFIAITEALQAIAAASAMLALAMLGFHYWSIVLSTVLGALAASVLTMLGRPCALRSPDFGRLASVLRASRYLLLSRLAWWFQTNVDRIIIGRVLGKGPLGAYTFASSVASLPWRRSPPSSTR